MPQKFWNSVQPLPHLPLLLFTTEISGNRVNRCCWSRIWCQFFRITSRFHDIGLHVLWMPCIWAHSPYGCSSLFVLLFTTEISGNRVNRCRWSRIWCQFFRITSTFHDIGLQVLWMPCIQAHLSYIGWRGGNACFSNVYYSALCWVIYFGRL